MNNGTAALHLALVALGLGPGDEVIVPTITYIATANAVRYCGSTPVLADVSPGTLNLDPGEIERKITPRTNVSCIGRVLIAQGRDASDVALSSTFGPNELDGFKVWCDEVQ